LPSRSAYSTSNKFHPRRLRHHLGQLGLAGARRAVEQHVHAHRLVGNGLLQQAHQHLHILGNEAEVAGRQRAARRGAGEHGHQLALVAVFAHQHRRKLFTHFHQVGQIRDVVLGNQVFHQADALQPRAGAQRLAHLLGLDAGDVGNHRIGLGGIADLELHQHAAQVALVARQGAVQQQRALGLVELQQAGERVDVLFHQRGMLLQRLLEPGAGGGEHRQQVARRVLGVLVEVEEQRALFIGPAPGTMAVEEGARRQRLMPSPEFVVFATPCQEGAQALQHRRRPDEVAPGQRHQAVEVAAHIELGALVGRQREHEVRAHQVQHRGMAQFGGRQNGPGRRIRNRTLDHG
jgi:hypothetical protein